MNTTMVEQFIKFFQEFIELCQTENWPDNNTSELELRNAFLISQHIEKSLDKLQNKGVLSEFLSVIDTSDDTSNNIKKNCLMDPPKYVLKKIINSKTTISQMDVGVKLFLELFSEAKLESCLTHFMLEAASTETLLDYLPKEMPKDKVLKFKIDLLLEEINNCNVAITDLLKDCDQRLVEVLVVSTLNNNPKYTNIVSTITKGILNVISNREGTVYKNFWHLFFKVDTEYFTEMCLQYTNIFEIVAKALIDCGKNIREDMSAEYFYIELSKTELVDNVRKICNNDSLRSLFFDIVNDYDSEADYWQNML